MMRPDSDAFKLVAQIVREFDGVDEQGNRVSDGADVRAKLDALGFAEEDIMYLSTERAKMAIQSAMPVELLSHEMLFTLLALIGGVYMEALTVGAEYERERPKTH